MSHDPEPPTRRIPPTPPGGVREREYVADPEREELRDTVRSLRTALVLVALLAVAALGVALYALLGEDDEEADPRRGASPVRIARLEDRIDELSDRVGDRATKNAVEDLDQRVQDLSDQVEQAGEGGGDTEQLQESIDGLGEDVAALEQRVEDLEAQQGAEPAP